MLLTPEDASLKNCPMTFNLSPDDNSNGAACKCCHVHCMGWQWESLGNSGGVAERGFCGMVNTLGRDKIQKAQLYY